MRTRNGIIHRDLKPENVIIAPDGSAKLMDFGLARSVASRMTSEGEITGTVFYLAPELALGKDFDGRADLYALGVMLYELATGRAPVLQGRSAHRDLAAHPRQRHPAPIEGADHPSAARAIDPAAHGQRSGRATRSRRRPRCGCWSPFAPGPAGGDRSRVVTDGPNCPRGKFIGRAAELEQAKATVGPGRRRPEDQSLLISGETGIGKTRILSELATHVEVPAA